jgi:predicted secreted Zn-dependent protease
VVLALLGLIVSPAAADRVEVIRRDHTFTIPLGSAAEMKASLKRIGPQGWWGYTRWHIAWRFATRVESGRCRLTSAQVTATIDVTLPTLASDGPTSCMRDSFATMLRALAAHEEEHVRIALETAEAIRRAMIEASGRATCDDLKAEVNADANRRLDEMRKAQAGFDALTNHGALKGVQLVDCPG